MLSKFEESNKISPINQIPCLKLSPPHNKQPKPTISHSKKSRVQCHFFSHHHSACQTKIFPLKIGKLLIFHMFFMQLFVCGNTYHSYRGTTTAVANLPTNKIIISDVARACRESVECVVGCATTTNCKFFYE